MLNLNLSNMCIFEGRMTSNTKYSSFQANGNTVEKATFSISVPKILSAKDKQAVKAGDKTIKTHDFINFNIMGSDVNYLRQYFPAGQAIKVVATYRTWETLDQTTGQKKYGSSFDVVQIGFPATSSNNAGSNNTNQQSQQQQNNYTPNRQAAPQAPQSNFEMFSQEEYPF